MVSKKQASSAAESASAQRVIKKHPNRRPYDTSQAHDKTFGAIKQMGVGENAGHTG